jgi:integrase/recombinase XerD
MCPLRRPWLRTCSPAFFNDAGPLCKAGKPCASLKGFSLKEKSKTGSERKYDRRYTTPPLTPIAEQLRPPDHASGAAAALTENIPTEEEMAALLDATDPTPLRGLRNRALLELLYATGIRSEELLTIAADDLSLSDKTLFVHGKGARDRIVPVGSWVMPWLLEYIEAARPVLMRKRKQSPLLFVTKAGGPIPHNNLSYIIRTQA